MITVRRVAPTEMARRHERYEKRLRRMHREEDHGPLIVDTALLLAMLRTRQLPWRGRKYGVPPIPWDQHCDLLELNYRLLRLSGDKEATFDELREVMRGIAAAVKKMVVPPVAGPISMVRRVLWRVWPNPFRKMTQQEAGWLIGFFLMSPEAGASSPLVAARRDRDRRREGGSSQNSDGSRERSQRGATRRRGGRGPTSTSRRG